MSRVSRGSNPQSEIASPVFQRGRNGILETSRSERVGCGERSEPHRSRKPPLMRFPLETQGHRILRELDSGFRRNDGPGNQKEAARLLVGPSRAERGIAGQIPPYPPLLRGDSAPPLLRRDSAPPLLRRDSAPPLLRRDSAPPLLRRDSAPPFLKGDTGGFVVASILPRNARNDSLCRA
jgi:hypothetical protein